MAQVTLTLLAQWLRQHSCLHKVVCLNANTSNFLLLYSMHMKTWTYTFMYILGMYIVWTMFEQVCTLSWMQIQSVRVYTWSEQRIKRAICLSICIYTCVHGMYIVQTSLNMANHCSSLYIHGTHMSVHCLSLFILLNACTWFISVHPGSPVSAGNISWRYAVRTSPVLGRTCFRQCYGTGIGCLVQTQLREVRTP
jgi:hypothetical protein